ncbi:MAG: DUF4115 domain-containing protein [Bacteroidetes bacterium]|nr:DUF4115 domain-containing protein [Bacteroidota bacterium]
MKEFGTYLRREREAAGLTLEDLHERTRISLKNLRLIESGDFPSIPQTYVRAFVREFARTIGLDEEETISAYNETAERDKGIPRPPAAIDSSNLLPRLDDTIEVIEPISRPPSHVEIEGTAEVETESFVPPVRKSSYVRDGDAEAIDIRTSGYPEAEHASTPPLSPKQPPAPPEATPVSTPTLPKNEAPATPSAPLKERAAAPPIIPEETPAAPKQTTDVQSTTPAETTAAPPRSHKQETSAPVAKTPQTEKQSAPSPRPPTREPAASITAAPAASGGSSLLPNVDAGNEKRIIGMGLVIIAMLAIGIYGIFFFSSGSGDGTAEVDSTSIKASIEAGRFIDSSQYALTELDLAPEDTVTQPITPPEPVEAKQRVFAREDSLVLEAFTSAPVWFSVKMDTLRTERGSLSSNEHRIWKARDYFVITLGDAGAVTFFLNGKEIGTLGDEGAVVKNLTLSRQQLSGN